MESIKTAGAVLGTGLNTFLSDWDKIAAAAAGISLLALGVYTAKGGTGVIARYVESRIGKPSLVRETSRVNLVDTIRHPIKTIKSIKVLLNCQSISVLFIVLQGFIVNETGQVRRCVVWSCLGAKIRGASKRYCYRNKKYEAQQVSQKRKISCFN